MCRSIKVLRRPEELATPDELRAAALQFVRKISGYNKPSRANQEAFDRAVAEVAESSRRLLEAVTRSSTHDSIGATTRSSSSSVNASK